MGRMSSFRGDYARAFIAGVLLETSLALSVISPVHGQASSLESDESHEKMSADEERHFDAFLLHFDANFRKSKLQTSLTAPTANGVQALNGPDEVIVPSLPDNNNPFPQDPTDIPGSDPNDTYFPFPVFSSRNGASERIGMEVLYQTLMFYGVAHVVEKRGTSVDFKIIKSKNNYFMGLTKLDVAFAIREFGRYLTAHLCGQPTQENFYRVFSQVPAEEIGLRFKYDMAWALMGNYLPKEPNAMFEAGRKWSLLQSVLTTSTVLRDQSTNDGRDIKSWVASLTDIMNIVQRLNKLLCYVDIRPDPKEELKKRIVTTKFLELDRKLRARYDEMKKYLEPAEKVGKQSELSALREPTQDIPDR